jgi:hypothetical protein
MICYSRFDVMRFFGFSLATRGRREGFEISNLRFKSLGMRGATTDRNICNNRQTGMSVLLGRSDRVYGMRLIPLLPLVPAAPRLKNRSYPLRPLSRFDRIGDIIAIRVNGFFIHSIGGVNMLWQWILSWLISACLCKPNEQSDNLADNSSGERDKKYA